MARGDVLVMRVSIPHEGGPVEGDVVADPNELLTAADVARLLGLQPSTWRAYVCRGQAPPADDPGVGPVNRRTPRWRLSTVREYRQAWLRRERERQEWAAAKK